MQENIAVIFAEVLIMIIDITKKNSIKGTITVPGDKSISHRAVMFGAISEGNTEIDGFLTGEDCLSTVRCLRDLGVEIILNGTKVFIHGKGPYLQKSNKELFVGNSGTTIRLLMGILSGQNFETILDGDDSIKKRPMSRVIIPLRMMGAKLKALEDNYAPVTIKGGNLKGITYNMPVSSAQVKSSIIFASLYANSETIIEEPYKSRDHTELMIKYFGGNIDIKDNKIICYPGNKLYGQKVIVPGDISSASYFIVGASILPNSEIYIKNVNINPTRTGIIDVIKKMGGNINFINKRILNNEMTSDIVVRQSSLKGVEIGGDIIPRLIDEIPIIAVAAVFAEGKTIIRDAEELKIKESNRIKTIVKELKKMGADIEETEDGMIINGTGFLKGTIVKTYKDHRIAMSLAIAGLASDGITKIEDAECVNISYPDFYTTLNML